MKSEMPRTGAGGQRNAHVLVKAAVETIDHELIETEIADDEMMVVRRGEYAMRMRPLLPRRIGSWRFTGSRRGAMIALCLPSPRLSRLSLSFPALR